MVEPRIHLALFVHRVDDVAPGVYLLPRDREAVSIAARIDDGAIFSGRRPACGIAARLSGSRRRAALAARVSCDQDIAADGFFSLGMIAAFDASLRRVRARRSIVISSGSEALSVRSCNLRSRGQPGRAPPASAATSTTPCTMSLGLKDHAFQSLYHFTVGTPVEDTRLTTIPAIPGRVTGDAGFSD